LYIYLLLDKMDLKARKPLTHNPTANFTMKREEFKQAEDLRLVSHFASYLSKVGDRPVTEEKFEADLMDGVCLCRLMSKLNGSGVTKFHDINREGIADAFKAKENMVTFQQASKALNLPITFGTEDLEKQNTTRVISTLIFLAHVAHSQNVTVEDMDQDILDKVEQLEEELLAKAEESSPGDGNLTWWQALLVKFGFGDWINSLSLEALKAYIATVRKNVETKVEEHKAVLLAKVEEQKTLVRQKSMDLREKLPEAIKSRIPVLDTAAGAQTPLVATN
jgi:hypothetical protein